MSLPSRLAPRACRFCRASPALRRTLASSAATGSNRTTGAEQAAWPQRHPRGEYYDILLREPPPYSNTDARKPPSSAHQTPPSQPPPPPPPAKEKTTKRQQQSAGGGTTTTTGASPARTYETISSRTAYSGASETATAEERARVIFGSRLLGPAARAERAAGRIAQSTSVAGVLIPPRPEEPDNCCMSGCVNCVWDLFREDMEEWTAKADEAKKRLAEEAAAGGGVGGGVGGGTGELTASSSPSSLSSVDRDSGRARSETKWPTGTIGQQGTISRDMWNDDVFQNVPVGIREFMKQEKRLKEKHQREGTSRG